MAGTEKENGIASDRNEVALNLPCHTVTCASEAARQAEVLLDLAFNVFYCFSLHFSLLAGQGLQ